MITTAKNEVGSIFRAYALATQNDNSVKGMMKSKSLSKDQQEFKKKKKKKLRKSKNPISWSPMQINFVMLLF